MTQIGLTVTILMVAIFLLGFIADPIINLYLDPLSAISTDPLSTINPKADTKITLDDDPSWPEHFLKGFASLGLLGFVKFFFTQPWNWFNIRGSGIGSGAGRRGGTTGRDRLGNLSWMMIIIGIATVLWVRYRLVSKDAVHANRIRVSIKEYVLGVGEH